jgi:hypothetical protein
MQRFQRPFRRISWLDSLVYGFQHRWETNPQYRAAASGVAGLAMILVLCACLGILTTAANAALAGFGVGSGNGLLSTNDTGTGKLAAGHTFPTATPPTVPAGALASGGAIPNSQTPKPGPTEAPTPTDTPTAAPCTSNCGGGGGGGNSGTVSGSASPTPWVHGQTGFIHAHTSAGNVGIAIILLYANGVTQTYEPAGQTDGAGNFTFSVQVLNSPGQVKITIMANFTPIAYADVYQQVA